MTEVGVRALKNRLSEYLRRVRNGERIVVTDRGVPIAELRPPEHPMPHQLSKLDQLRAQGATRPRLRDDPFTDWPDIHLPPGTAQQLIDELRDETHES
jgi:prevent-host-death family protein